MTPRVPVLLLRHAQSTWNAESRWQGQADPPLSEVGEAQAVTAARRIERHDGAPFDQVVSSDLRRASTTAALIRAELGIDAPHALEPGLREYDVGRWSGLTRAEIDRQWPDEVASFDTGRLDAPPGGERRADFDRRVRLTAQRVARSIIARRVARCLIVAHGGVLRSLARAAGLPEVRFSHLSGYRAEAGAEGLVLLEIVDMLPPPGGLAARAHDPAPAEQDLM